MWEQQTSFVFTVFRCVLYTVTKLTRVGLPISKAVIKVALEINTQQTKLKENRLNIWGIKEKQY